MFLPADQIVFCQQLRPVLIVLELAPLRPRKIKDNTNRENSKFSHPPPPQGTGGVSKMARVPKGEIFSPTTPTLWLKNSPLMVSI